MCEMASSNEKKVGTVKGAVAWLGSSFFGLAGTVLLVCWLMAYALEPDGAFAGSGLILAVAAYGLDLAREQVSAYRDRTVREMELQKQVATPSPAKAA
jgi:hypothetical protein